LIRATQILDTREHITEVLQILIDLIVAIWEKENEHRLTDGDIM
jgi:hypothetical protein